MDIAIIGATGNVGSRLLDEALQRGHRVTALARHASSLAPRERLTTRNVDIADGDALVAALADHDAVFSAVRFLGAPAAAIIGPVKRAGVRRLLVVGGAGSLEVGPGVQLADTPGFPAAYLGEANAGRDFLGALRRERDLDWTFLSPSESFMPGQRTGKFRLGGDSLLTDATGKSWVSIEDFAIAFLDELERPAHSRRRFTVGY
ncbi:NAD(P)-dependent oxidoreductase [Dokdonella soli]|uniref:NAD(P)-dependent oxidoreductase n=1 Tax=Dokdonella soli TaxID=529810 RepID=A0ABP3TR34_9GAMM